jgi:ATP-dependent Lon protease
MNKNFHPGFEWHSRTPYYKDPLLLPRPLVDELNHQTVMAEDDEETALTDQVNSIIKKLMSRGDISFKQLNDYLVNFTKHAEQAAQAAAEASYWPEDKRVTVFDMATILATKMDSHTSKNLKAVLNRFKSHDSGKRRLKKISADFVKRLQVLKAYFPNSVEFIEFVEGFVRLSLKQDYPVFYFPPVLLVGPAGIGKTAVVNDLAKLVGVLVRQVDLAATTAGMVLGGMSTQWSDAKTGVVIDLLRDGEFANPIVILDELDKASLDAKHDPLGPLYPLLEADTAAKFIDEALDMPSNASHVLYVATANQLDTIPKPILSRFTVLHIQDISPEQHRTVTQSIYRSLLTSHNCQGLFKPAVDASVVNALSQQSPRQIKAVLRRAMAKAAKRCPKAKRLQVTAAVLVKP